VNRVIVPTKIAVYVRELRVTTSLACLLRDQGRSADAVACLRLIYDRFTDGSDTADLIAANGFWIRLGAGARRWDTPVLSENHIRA
jgi:hypothetical protein